MINQTNVNQGKLLTLLLIVSKERLIRVEAHQTMVQHPPKQKGAETEENGKVVKDLVDPKKL